MRRNKYYLELKDFASQGPLASKYRNGVISGIFVCKVDFAVKYYLSIWHIPLEFATAADLALVGDYIVVADKQRASIRISALQSVHCWDSRARRWVIIVHRGEPDILYSIHAKL